MLNHILVALDGSTFAESALPHAVALAQTFDSKITLLRVVERDQATSGSLSRITDPLTWQIHKAEAKSYLDEITGRLEELGLTVEKVLREGDTAERIIEHAHRQNVNLTILSSHGRSGSSEWNINSVVQEVLLRVYMPTLIVRAYQPAPEDLTDLHYERVLVPLDCSQRAETILPLAISLARRHGSRLVVAHVVSTPEVPRRTPLTDQERNLIAQITEHNRHKASQYLDQLKSRLPFDVQTHLLVGHNAAAALHQLVLQESIDLVALSAHGYSAEAQWPYGGVALNFIAYGRTPLLIMQDIPEQEALRTRAQIAAE